jgi:hypothetical protein
MILVSGSTTPERARTLIHRNPGLDFRNWQQKTPLLPCLTAFRNLIATGRPAGLLTTSIQGLSVTATAWSHLVVQLTVRAQSLDHAQSRVNSGPVLVSQRTMCLRTLITMPHVHDCSQSDKLLKARKGIPLLASFIFEPAPQLSSEVPSPCLRGEGQGKECARSGGLVYPFESEGGASSPQPSPPTEERQSHRSRGSVSNKMRRKRYGGVRKY